MPDNSQANHRGILTNSATSIDFASNPGASHLTARSRLAEFVRILPRLVVSILPRRAEPDGAEQMPTIRRRTTAEFSRIPLRDKIPLAIQGASHLPLVLVAEREILCQAPGSEHSAHAERSQPEWSRCRQIAGEPPRNSHEFRYEIRFLLRSEEREGANHFP